MRMRRLLGWRRDLVVAIAVPVVGKAISVAAQRLRQRRGPNRLPTDPSRRVRELVAKGTLDTAIFLWSM
jgi:hypothetical protein